MLSGKTQFCLHAAAVTSLRGSAVVYLQTEGSFPLARLQQIVRARYLFTPARHWGPFSFTRLPQIVRARLGYSKQRISSHC